MNVSTKARYGTRAMLDLALGHEKGPVQLRQIAARQEVSLKYLEHLFAALKTAGLVKAIRGVHGGYVLSRSPDRIQLIDIFEALEGPIALVRCVDDPEVCPRKDTCVTRELWAEITEALARILAATTLEDLVSRHREKERPDATMYYI